MHIERAIRVINLLDVPDPKRKFWPQQSAIVVRNSTREILDVIQLYANALEEYPRYAQLYRDATAFFAYPGDYPTVADLQARIDWCFASGGKTYVVGRGFLSDDKDSS